MSEVVSLKDHSSARPSYVMRSGQQTPPVFFDRLELSLILQVYGRMVAKSEWRDYAIGNDKHSCTFAVFHRAADQPAFQIVKEPKLGNKQGAYCVQNQGGRILKRGKSLPQVLKVFDKKRFKTVE